METIGKIICIMLWVTALNTAESKENQFPNENPKECLTPENFELINDHVLLFGLETKDVTTGSTFFDELFENWGLILKYCKDEKRITVTHYSQKNGIPPYVIKKKENGLEISAYYSRADPEKDVKSRQEDWCKLLAKIKTKRFSEDVMAYLELGDRYWKSKELWKAQHYYQLFVDSLKARGKEDEIPTKVLNKFKQCEKRKY